MRVGHWLGYFVLWVGCLCVVLSIEPYDMPGGGWWLAACAACAYATYFAATYTPTPPTIPALDPPPGRCRCCYRSLLPPPCPTPPPAHPFGASCAYTIYTMLPAASCSCSLQPTATDLAILLRSYLQPSHLPCLLSTRLRVAVGAGDGVWQFYIC
jgi:hypothetical protein